MRLVLDPLEDAAHGDWLRRTPGAYEWWYYDALSDDGVWALVCIWFLGNPFSPYYRHSARGAGADPFDHNALFFALYRHGRLYAYHFTRFPRASVCADETRPATLRFGPNASSFDDCRYHLHLADENANRRVLNADLVFCPPAPNSGGAKGDVGVRGASDDHFWLPAAPSCRVAGDIMLRERHSVGATTIRFAGRGYHDHNWGTLPFTAGIRGWYWARAALANDRALILYHVDYQRPREPVSHLLLFDGGRLIHHDPQAMVTQNRARLNVFGTRYASALDVCSADIKASFHLGRRMDSAPFYIRTLCRASASIGGIVEEGTGVAEYFWPRPLSSWLTASAMRARIVEA